MGTCFESFVNMTFAGAQVVFSYKEERIEISAEVLLLGEKLLVTV